MPRTGAGVARHVAERLGGAGDGVVDVGRRRRPAPSEPPVIGVRAASSPLGPAAPHSARIAATRSASAAVVGRAALTTAPPTSAEGVGEDVERRVGLGAGDDERRRHADRPLAARQHEQAALEARPLEGLGGVVVGEVDADHQAAAAHLLDQRLRDLQRGAARRAGERRRRRRWRPARLDEVERGQRGGAGDGVAAERRAVAARLPSP